MKQFSASETRKIAQQITKREVLGISLLSNYKKLNLVVPKGKEQRGNRSRLYRFSDVVAFIVAMEFRASGVNVSHYKQAFRLLQESDYPRGQELVLECSRYWARIRSDKFPRPENDESLFLTYKLDPLLSRIDESSTYKGRTYV